MNVFDHRVVGLTSLQVRVATLHFPKGGFVRGCKVTDMGVDILSNKFESHDRMANRILVRYQRRTDGTLSACEPATKRSMETDVDRRNLERQPGRAYQFYGRKRCS